MIGDICTSDFFVKTSPVAKARGVATAVGPGDLGSIPPGEFG